MMEQSMVGGGQVQENKLGAIKDKKPDPRDGHSSIVTE